MDALKEFETLTNKQLPKLTKAGQAASAKKVGGFLKLNRTVLFKLAESYDKALIGKDAAKLESARKKLTDQLKVFSTDFAKQGEALATADPAMKTGLDVLSKRLTQFALNAKMQGEQKLTDLKQQKGATPGPSETTRNDIRQVYLGIRKGADETEALMTKFIAQPTDKHFIEAFASQSGPRSIGASVNYWKKKVVPSLPAGFDVKRTLGEDPEVLIKHIHMLTQRREKLEDWTDYIGYGRDGWEKTAIREAKGAIKWMANWRAVAAKMKAYNDQ